MQNGQTPAWFTSPNGLQVATALEMYRAMSHTPESIRTRWFDAKYEPPVHTGAYLYRFQFGDMNMERALIWDGTQFVRPGTHSKFHVCEGDQWRGLSVKIDDYA